MKEETSLALSHDLFQLMKQLPRLKFKTNSMDGLTPGEQGLLMILVINLGDARKSFKVSELSSLLHITPAGVTHLINPLEEAGYVERLPHAKDRRIVLVGLTEKGLQAAEALISESREGFIALVDHLGEEDSRTFIRLLSTAIDFFAVQAEQ